MSVLNLYNRSSFLYNARYPLFEKTVSNFALSSCVTKKRKKKKKKIRIRGEIQCPLGESTLHKFRNFYRSRGPFKKKYPELRNKRGKREREREGNSHKASMPLFQFRDVVRADSEYRIAGGQSREGVEVSRELEGRNDRWKRRGKDISRDFN